MQPTTPQQSSRWGWNRVGRGLLTGIVLAAVPVLALSFLDLGTLFGASPDGTPVASGATNEATAAANPLLGRGELGSLVLDENSPIVLNNWAFTDNDRKATKPTKPTKPPKTKTKTKTKTRTKTKTKSKTR